MTHRTRLWAAILIGVAATLGVAAPAFADAALRETSPKDGAVLTAPPGTVTFTFNEKLQGRFTNVTVTAAGGDAVAVAEATTDGPTVTQPLPGTLAAAEYTVQVRVVSADGHPVTGKTSFRVQTPSPSAVPSTVATVVPSLTPVAAPADPDAGSGTWLWAVGGAVAAAIAGVLVAGRRRRSA
jgi:methionine-rich copper-binding protein CopC